MARKRKRPPLLPAPRFSGRLYIRLEPGQTRLFRYLLEAYDNLAYSSVADRKACILKLVYSPQQKKEFLSALDEIRQSVRFEALPLNLALCHARLPAGEL